MKFQADRDVLLNLLSKAAGTVSNKEVQPILKNFQIKAEGDTLACLSTDMSLGALAEIPIPTITEEGTVCAPATETVATAMPSRYSAHSFMPMMAYISPVARL